MRMDLVRHGRTAGNLRGAYVGRGDEPLLAEWVPAKAVPAPGAVYSSPLRRCLQTAALLYPAAQPVCLQALIERDFGELEGKTHAEIIRLPGFAEWGMTERSMPFPGGEEMDAFLARSMGAVWQVLQAAEGAGQEHVAAVTHGGVIMAAMHMLHPQSAYHDWRCPNAAGYRLHWRGRTLTRWEPLHFGVGENREGSGPCGEG